MPDTVTGMRSASSNKPDKDSCPCAASVLEGVTETASAHQPRCFPVLAGPAATSISQSPVSRPDHGRGSHRWSVSRVKRAFPGQDS